MYRVHGWTGRKDRHPVAIDAVVHRNDGSKSPVKLTNFSDEGCRIERFTYKPTSRYDLFQIGWEHRQRRDKQYGDGWKLCLDGFGKLDSERLVGKRAKADLGLCSIRRPEVDRQQVGELIAG